MKNKYNFDIKENIFKNDQLKRCFKQIVKDNKIYDRCLTKEDLKNFKSNYFNKFKKITFELYPKEYSLKYNIENKLTYYLYLDKVNLENKSFYTLSTCYNTTYVKIETFKEVKKIIKNFNYDRFIDTFNEK